MSKRIMRFRLCVGVSAISALFYNNPASAQIAPGDAVSVCSGVSLSRSTITDVITPIIEGIVAPTENTVNNALGIIEIIPIVGATIPDLSIDTTTLLSDAAAGGNISLQVVALDGDLVGPADMCAATADAFQLDTEGGISIGGNQITGLGTGGEAAIAGEADSIAFGNNAVTDATATQSIALGTDANVAANAVGSLALGAGASVDAANSAALGQNSIALRGGTASYTAIGVTGAQSSVGEVSIGSAGAARQLTNLAAGSADTDAVNVAQLTGVASALDISIDTLGTDIAAHLGGGASYDGLTAQISAPSYTVNGVGYNTVGGAIAALNAAAGGTPTGDLGPVGVSVAALIGGGVSFNPVSQQVDGPFTVDGTSYTTIEAAIDGETANSVQYDDGSFGTVTLAGAGGTRLTNLIDGSLSAASSDAVTGAQLFATNQAVTFNTTAINNLQQQFNNFTASGGTGAVVYADPATPDQPNDGTQTDNVTFVGASGGAVVVSNVADGDVSEGSTQAVNGGQLWQTNQNVASAQATADQALVLSANSVQYDAGGQAVTFGPGGDPVRLQNVARGVAPTDAVNVEQLNEGLNDAVAQSMAYTDQQIENINLSFDALERHSNAGTASALAAAGLPQANERGKSMLALGVGLYENQHGVAFGFSRAFAEGHALLKVGANYNSANNLGASAGVGWQF
ncbi:hypothetical protein DX908_05685 [Parvularcula marina]|uniref:Trimeric autotransporter adhesin YadA-like C-terminal membrane anchor domain-containing protein n=1 Tax=Parvularcula marina TaxID=2292771 RepID=A0A371RH84_9PROT|nr:hypothetical protein DX908_05685 [Parvularcula marina]